MPDSEEGRVSREGAERPARGGRGRPRVFDPEVIRDWIDLSGCWETMTARQLVNCHSYL